MLSNALLTCFRTRGPAPVKPWEKIDLESFDLDQTLAELARLAVAHDLAENTQSRRTLAMRAMGLLPNLLRWARHFSMSCMLPRGLVPQLTGSTRSAATQAMT